MCTVCPRTEKVCRPLVSVLPCGIWVVDSCRTISHCTAQRRQSTAVSAAPRASPGKQRCAARSAPGAFVGEHRMRDHTRSCTYLGPSREAETTCLAHSSRLPSPPEEKLKIKWGLCRELMRAAPNGPEGHGLATFLWH